MNKFTFSVFSEKLIKSILILPLSQFATADKTRYLNQVFGANYKSKTTIITERGDTMAGGGELLNNQQTKILTKELLHSKPFIKYYKDFYKLDINSDELHVLNIIYSFESDNKVYNGSNKYLCDELGFSKNKALRILNNLIDKKYLIKETSKGRLNSIYKINYIILYQNLLNKQCKNSTVKQCQNRTVNSNEMLQPNNQNYEKISQLTNNDNAINYEKNSQIQCQNGTVNSAKMEQLNNINSAKMEQIQCQNGTVNSAKMEHNKNIYNNNNNIYAHSKNEHDKTKTKIKSKRSKEELEKKFIEFWDKYPKKVSKKNAKKAFIKLNPSDEQLEKIYKALAEQTKKWKDKQFIPYPATWINGERWEDETDTTAKQNNTSGIYEDKKIEYVPVHENLME